MVPLPISLNDTLGAAFIGNILAACLYGLTTLQTSIYFGRCRKDSTVMKGLVTLLWALDTLHLLLISHTVYSYTISNFGNIPALLKPTWSVLVLVTGVSDGIIRALYCYRIWIVSGKNWLVCAAIAIASLVTLGSSLAYTIVGLRSDTYIDLEKFSWLLYFSLAWTFLSDLLIAVTMCILLSKRRYGNFRKVDHTIRVLILYSINTGALTTLCTLMALIAYAASPHTFIYIGFYFLLPKLLLNSVLGTLNARKTLREQMSGGVVSIPLPDMSGSAEASADRTSEGGRFHEIRRSASAVLDRGKVGIPAGTDCIVIGPASRGIDA
ncbi:hypothetical protein ONZ51_g3979 [Trametes cubensis]|uniref:DUF6534 domain-containing protein n=1 Tax=Trametes cubensis TaxID=1111947 RepID=A0AAD7TZ80_9APHY|nr:hypothetical protein ONZ51_g3979 [Trametes cubensis]